MIDMTVRFSVSTLHCFMTYNNRTMLHGYEMYRELFSYITVLSENKLTS